MSRDNGDFDGESMMSYNAYSDNDLEELYTDTCSPSMDDWEEHYYNNCSPNMEDTVEYHKKCDLSSMESDQDYTFIIPSKRDIDKLAKSRDATSSSRRDRKSTRLNSSHITRSRMPSSA